MKSGDQNSEIEQKLDEVHEQVGFHCRSNNRKTALGIAYESMGLQNSLVKNRKTQKFRRRWQ